MARMFSTFAMAGWTGYHAVAAFALAASGPSAGVLPAGAALTAAVHAVLAIGALAAAAMVQTRTERQRGEILGLVLLATGLALAAALFLAGGQGNAPGLYAACVLLTLCAFAFDHLIGSEDVEDEVDHDAFMRYAAELGAGMGRDRDAADRRSGFRR